MARRVKLEREWLIGEQIGAGGFGRVFAAKSTDGDSAVVKLVPKEPGADRELLFVDLGGARNVVPVIDKGEAGNDWAMVMPRADNSLRQHLSELGRALEVSKATSVLLDVATTLSDVEGKVVHRDVKPENILYLDGAWCLADFGISRYAEASTAPHSHKYSLSPPYAAPERWRHERATTATDVYSLGVIAFELLTLNRPFPGPTLEDFMEQHLHQDAPDLKNAPTTLKALVSECLYKAAGARPGPANLLARLQSVERGAPSGGRARLHEAHLAEVARRSESERLASQSRSKAEQRAALFRSAKESWEAIQSELTEAIMEAAPAATPQRGKRGGVTLSLGNAQIEVFPAMETGENPWEWEAPSFDVIAHAGIIVRIPRDQYGYEGRSHSFWFCDAMETGRYQWFEMAFMINPLVARTTTIRPFLIDPGQEAAKALWVGVSEYQLAWPIQAVNLGDLDELIDRWANWFADAADGRLRSPSVMPERATPRNWRQK